jgi:type IV pilus assembly protein PilN
MTSINLLPWREESREQRRKAFLGKLFSAVLVAIVLVFIWITVAQARLDNQNSRNSYLQSNIDEMDKKVAEISELKNKKQEMISRMKVIQDLQGNRSEIVKVFDELVRATPDGVYLSALEQTANSVKMSGFSESNNRISALMRNLDTSHKYQESNLTKVQQDTTLGDQGSVFDLQIKIEKFVVGESEVIAP